MTELVFKKKVFSVDIYGNKYELRKPTGIEKQIVLDKLEEINQKRASKENLKGNEDFIVFKEFVESVGLEKDIFDSMYEEDQVELVGHLLNIKKS